MGNKYLSTASKVKYKTIVRPALTYTTETRADTSKTKQLLRRPEVNTLRIIVGKTQSDKMKLGKSSNYRTFQNSQRKEEEKGATTLLGLERSD